MPFGPHLFHNLILISSFSSPQTGRNSATMRTWTAEDGIRQVTRLWMGSAWGMPSGSPEILRCQHQLHQSHENQGSKGRMPAWLKPQLHLTHGQAEASVGEPADSLAHQPGGWCCVQGKPTLTPSWRHQLLRKLPMANSSKVRVVEFLPRGFVTVSVTLYFTVEKSWMYRM